MEDFIVHTKGFVNVEAENPKEAKEKAREKVFQEHDANEITSFEPEPSDKDLPYFQAKLSRAGRKTKTAGVQSTHGIFVSDSATDILMRLNKTLARDLVGEEKDLPLLLEFTQLFLATLDQDAIDRDEFWEKVDDLKTAYNENGVEDVVASTYVLDEEMESDE